jgi:fibronectin-binding autotransporter adhesin
LVGEGSLRVVDGGPLLANGTRDDPLNIFLMDGELEFDRSDDLTVHANIWHDDDPAYKGTLVQAGSGMLTLAGQHVMPSAIRIESGALRIGDDGDAAPDDDTDFVIRSKLDNEGSLIFDTNVIADWRGSISGSGSVVLDGSGQVLLSGAMTYTGGTIVNNGFLMGDGVLPGNVVVNQNGGMRASLAGNLSNAGVVNVLLSDSAVGGDYVQASTGLLALYLGSKLDVAGTATLDGTLRITGANPGYVANTHTEVLTAAGGITGTFTHLSKKAGVVFTSWTINYDANSVWLDTTGLDITIAAAGDGIGYTPASMSAAVRTQGAFEQLNDRISTNSLAGVSNAFLQSAGQFQQAASIEAAQASLRSLSGQLHAASAAMTFRAIDAGNQALSDHLDNLRDGNAAYGMWTQQLGSGGGMARNGFDGVGFQLNGWLVGNDYRLGRNGVLGFAFGQGQGVQQLQAGADRDASRRTEGMVYAGLTSDRWYAQGRLGFGQFRQDVNRQLLLGNAAEGVWTRYGGRYQVAYGESGLRWNRGNVRIAPFVSMEYARSDRDAFAEEGAGGFGLRSDAQSQARWQAAVGLRAARQWNFGGGRSLDVGAHAQWFRTLGMDGEAMDASFVGLQQWSPLLGIGLSRHGSLAGVGLDARLSPRAMFKLGYDYERGQYDSAHGMTAALNVAF